MIQSLYQGFPIGEIVAQEKERVDMKKRTLSMLLALVMLTGLLPIDAQAEEPAASLAENELTVVGTDGFGTLLSEDITQKQETLQEQEVSGYTVTALEITGNIATVTYDSLEEATLVVAIYSEDGMQLLTSGKVTVDPTQTQAEVTISGKMPNYFRASAYLLDSYDMSPLCPAFDTPLYTRQMQELLASTAEDYDADLVLNLDEDTTTNFAVYAETTKLIQPAQGVNTVVSTDDETRTYVIENADDQIISLQAGDIFSYAYGEYEILIVKVASIIVDGTTATITGGELEMQEAFSYVKVEGESSTGDLIVDDSTAYEGITYEGLVTQGPEARSLSGGASATASHQFGCDLDIEEETDYLSANISMVGTLTLEMEVGVYYYVSMDTCYVEFKATPTVTLEASLGGRITGKLPLGEITVSPVPGVYVGFEPQLELSFAGKIGVTVKLETTIGVRYDNESGLQNISTTPQITPNLDVEATIFFGIDFQPKVTLLGDSTVKLSMKTLVGVELTVKTKGTDYELYTGRETQRHTCRECLDISITFKAELTGKLQFFNCKWLEVKIDIGKWSMPVGKAYYSVDLEEFGSDTCPHLTYRLTVTVTDANESPVSGAQITTRSGEVLGSTNSNGVLVTFRPGGVDQLTVTTDSHQTSKVVQITDGVKVQITLGAAEETADDLTIFDTITEQERSEMGIVDEGSLAASGTCGAGVTWKLYSSGTLYITGSGRMDDYDNYTSYAPWNNKLSAIKKVVILDGVTSIGTMAFYNCTNLTGILISDSVSSIGGYAFGYCTSLTGVTIPDSVIDIGYSAFYSCKSLNSVTISKGVTNIANSTFFGCASLTSVTLPNSVTSIGKWAFENCTSLAFIQLPNSVTSIENGAFQGCTGLKTMSIPEGVTRIGGSVFRDCTGLTGITCSEYVTSIGSEAFYNCTSLTDFEIPKEVTEIGERAFSHCTSLTRITVPEGVTVIPRNAFEACVGLTGITLPKGLTGIGEDAFEYCRNLTSIIIPSGVTSIGQGAFIGCSGLTEIAIPDGVTSIGVSLFASCTALKEIKIPAGVTKVGMYAFADCTSLADVYYTGTQEQWNGITLEYNNAYLTNATIHFIGPALAGTMEQQMTRVYAVFGGEYGTGDTGVKTASFENLVPGAEYVLLVLTSLDEEPLSFDHLLYIDQATAGEDGTAFFRYIPRVKSETAYVMVCGASAKNLEDAEITFPEMTAHGEAQVVEPIVVYDGKTLAEGQDYVLTGDVDFTEAGVYTCYIRGIHGYTGLVSCRYEVVDEADLFGDINGDGRINVADVAKLYAYIRGSGTPNDGRDINADGRINIADAATLYAYIRGKNPL